MDAVPGSRPPHSVPRPPARAISQINMEFLMSTLTKKAALGAVAALIASAGTIGAAEAHGFCKHRFYSPVYVVGHSDCSLYQYKWLKTGKLFWKLKYMKCMSYSY
jgi:hypothetical protein